MEIHQAADAYLALETLSRDPRINRDRIAMVGLSAGGNAALLASIEALRIQNGSSMVASSPPSCRLMTKSCPPIARSKLALMASPSPDPFLFLT